MWATVMNGALLVAMISLEMSAAPWIPINDGVMGGISSGTIVQDGESLVFSGELSLENNGGFASARRLVEADLTGTDRVRISIRGDGRTYQFRIRQDEHFDGIAWRVTVATTGDWQSVELPLTEFEAVFRGRKVPAAGPVIAGRVRQVGFMLADKQAGPFRLEIRAIEFLAGTGRGR